MLLGSRLRGAALLLLGALVLHQARYILAFGPDAGAVERATGHAYLTTVAPLLVAGAVAVTIWTVLVPRIERVLAPPSGPAGMSLGERAGLFAFALLAIFFSQELAEGFAAGDGAPLAGLAGQGVWLALPLAVGLGLVAAVCSRLLDHAEATVAVRVRPRVPRRAPAVLLARPAPIRAAAYCSPLAFGLSRRPPPVLLCGC